MKKIFTLIALAVCSLSMMAKDYAGHLVITVAGTPVEKDANISIEETKDGYTLTLKNFDLSLEGDNIAVGTIKLEGVKATTVGGLTTLTYKADTKIQDGDDGREYQMVDAEVPIDMTGLLSDNAFSTNIDIDLGFMKVGVDFTSEGYQLPNSGFEYFHTAKLGSATSDEPNGWHSFMSASGDKASLAGGTPHTFISDNVRPGSTGKQSVKILAVDMALAIANGTITTGRMNADSWKASDTDKNYAWMDMTKTDLDDNKDPFYAKMNGMPDSLEVWIVYGQGNPKGSKAKDHPYATVTAIITDGTEFHEPAPSNTTYSNIFGEARNAKIESTNGSWKKITIPFEYDKFKSNNVEPKAILATISTNADAGMGSNNDTILVDDIRLIYNAGVKSISVKGTDVALVKDQNEYSVNATGAINAADINVVSDGQGAIIAKSLESVDGGVKATIIVASNDLKKANTYVLNIAGATTGINKTQTVKNNAVSAIYNVNGQQVSNMDKAGLYIIKNADGSTVKFMKK